MQQAPTADAMGEPRQLPGPSKREKVLMFWAKWRMKHALTHWTASRAHPFAKFDKARPIEEIPAGETTAWATSWPPLRRWPSPS